MLADEAIFRRPKIASSPHEKLGAPRNDNCENESQNTFIDDGNSSNLDTSGIKKLLKDHKIVDAKTICALKLANIL